MSNNKIYGEVVNSIIQTSIPTFHDEVINNKTETLFDIHLHCIYNNKHSKLEKTYQDFSLLYTNINSIIPDVPKISSGLFSNLFKSASSFDTLTNRLELLNNFLKQCMRRKDILSCDYFINFLEIEKYFPEILRNKPVSINTKTFNQVSVNDIILLEEKKILFLLCNDMDITSRLDSYMSKNKILDVLPWKEKKEKKKTNMSSNEVKDKEKPLGCVGSFNVYKLINITNKKLNQKNIKYDKIFEKNYEEMTGSFYYDEDSNILAVGFVSGKIFIYKVPPEENYTHFDFMIELYYHKGKITGISIDNKLGYIFSCGEDKKLFVGDYSEIYSPNFIPIQLNEKNPTIKEYIKLELDKINNRLFCATSDRRIEIYLTNENPPVFVNNIETSCKGRLTDFIINYTKNYLFCVDSKGNISVIDFNKPGKEKLGKEISTFNYYDKKVNFTSIIYYEQRNELITGDTEGRLIVWSLKKGRPILVHKIYKRPITKMQFFVEKEMDCNLLMVSYDDCNMNLVKIPDRWLEKEELEKFEENEIKASSDLNAMIYLQKNMERDENYNSDEDSLNGWDYFANYTHDEEEMKRDML